MKQRTRDGMLDVCGCRAYLRWQASPCNTN
jgi:hypothetical protein